MRGVAKKASKYGGTKARRTTAFTAAQDVQKLGKCSKSAGKIKSPLTLYMTGTEGYRLYDSRIARGTFWEIVAYALAPVTGN
jgi:hypothetical protein